MRAVVMQGGELVVEDVPEPVPGPGQVLLAPHATGICGSDLHARDALAELAIADGVPLRIVPGHEFAGEVMAVGPGTATDLVPGDLVTAIPFSPGAAGPETIGLSPLLGGGLAELTLTDAVRTFRLPEGLETRLGALCEPVAVAVRAVDRGAPSGPVVVVGAGPIGLGIVAVAVATDRRPIVVVEPSAARRAMAVRLGADVVVAPGQPLAELLAGVGYTPSTISPLLDGEPEVATVFECVGRPAIVESILGEAPPHACVVLAGACGQPVQAHPLTLTLNEVTVRSSYAYRPADFRTALRLLRDRADLFGPFVTSERPLEETAAAFDALASNPDEVKILVRPRR